MPAEDPKRSILLRGAVLSAAMDIRIRKWMGLSFYDPAPVLIALREFEQSGVMDGMPYEVHALRTRELKPFLERRQCAIFAYLMGQYKGTPVDVAYIEESDYDAVMRYRVQDEVRFVPVQMKELSPAFLPSPRSLQQLLDGLKAKYPDSADLTVAVHLNRELQQLRLDGLDLRGLRLGGLWFFGGCDHTGELWRILGDVLSPAPDTKIIAYPRRGAP